MSLQPDAMGPVPEETARVARAAFPKGNDYMRLRDRLGTLYRDEQFAGLFPRRGQPAEAPWRLALVSVLQFAEGLSDRQAAEAVRSRIDWKYLLGLPLSDPGFDFSVLSEFRARLLAGQAEKRVFDLLLERLDEQGLLKQRGRQRTDSTHVLGAIRTLNRLECVGEVLRAALNDLATLSPAWLQEQVEPDWFALYASRVDNYRLPKKETDRQALAERIGRDGMRLMQALWHPSAPVWLRAAPTVETLRRVWVQQFFLEGGELRLRAVQDQPPSVLLIHSPYDPEARYATKRTTTWTGYKVHVTETCDPEHPHLLTEIETTPAPAPDVAALPRIHQELAAQQRLPSEHLVDEGYTSAQMLLESQRKQIDLLGPVSTDHTRQAQEKRGYDITAFQIDWQAEVARCPQGRLSRTWHPTCDRHGMPVVQIRFDPADCQVCPSHAVCLNPGAAARMITPRLQEAHTALLNARWRQRTPAFQSAYAARAGIEGTISLGVRTFGLRRARYIGHEKTHLQHLLIGAAINLARVVAWFAGTPVEKTRTSPFAKLAVAM